MNDAGSRVVVVTGAASGIGRAVALRLATDADTLVLLDRDGAGLAETAERAERAGASGTLPYAVDVSDGASVDEALGAAVDTVGPFDGLVSAAGTLEPGTLEEVTEDAWQRHLAVNATGVFHLLRTGAPRIRDGGAVVVVSSNAARVARAGMLAYAASKAAASALTRCAGLELAARGIRCNVVEPGSTDTPMLRALWPDPAVGAETAIEGDPQSHRLGIPLRRLAAPEDVADVVRFLLTDASRHVTLQQLFVDGGASL